MRTTYALPTATTTMPITQTTTSVFVAPDYFLEKAQQPECLLFTDRKPALRK